VEVNQPFRDRQPTMAGRSQPPTLEHPDANAAPTMLGTTSDRGPIAQMRRWTDDALLPVRYKAGGQYSGARADGSRTGAGCHHRASRGHSAVNPMTSIKSIVTKALLVAAPIAFLVIETAPRVSH
jgi:hypothetical protein